MSRETKTGSAAIRRWREERRTPHRKPASLERRTFAEDLRLFEQQAREESGRGAILNRQP